MVLTGASIILTIIKIFLALSVSQGYDFGYIDYWRKFEEVTSDPCKQGSITHVHEREKDREEDNYIIQNTRDCIRAFYDHRITRPAPKFCRALNWQNLTRWSRKDMRVKENDQCLSFLRNVSPRGVKLDEIMCKYSIERDNVRLAEDVDAYVIKESDCVSKSSIDSSDNSVKIRVQKMALFEVLTKGNMLCMTTYNSSLSYYQVTCPRSPHSNRNSERNANCIYVWLNYEAGDAFNDVSGFLPPLRAPIQAPTSGVVCEDYSQNGFDIFNANIASNGQALIVNKTEKEQIHLRECLAVREVFYVGDSHLRYLFDAALLTFSINPHERSEVAKKLRSMPHHHGYVRFGNSTYYPLHFSYQLAKILLSDFCEPGKDGHKYGGNPGANPPHAQTVIVNPGAWDLDYMPLREVLSPGMAPELVNTIRDMALGNANCTRAVNLVVITPLPYPRRGTKSSLRGPANMQNEGGYRNEYSVGALNDYWIRELGKIQAFLPRTRSDVGGEKIPFFSLHIVDGFSVVPHSVRGRMERVCGFHYLCPKRDRFTLTMESTETGNRLFNRVLDAALLCPAKP